MSSIVESLIALIQKLLNDPEHEGLLAEAATQLRQNPRQFAEAANTILPAHAQLHAQIPPPISVSPASSQVTQAASARHRTPAQSTSDHVPDARSTLNSGEEGVGPQEAKVNTWHNCISNQSCQPAEIVHPKSLADLIDAVAAARADNKTLRAAGSGHSFSDVAVTDGILLLPQGMAKMLSVDTTVLGPGVDAATLFSVESGITIRNLNLALDAAHLALINMGAYDGQTLAGAISTGTHGTGAGLGGFPSSVRALVLVSEDGTVYQIEPDAGISDPVKFAAKYPNVVLKQDDDWFQSNVLAMGCTGVIYSYTLAVMPAYYLDENRTATTWEALRPQLLNAPAGQLPEIVTAWRHYEIDVNPYAVDGAHTCIVTTRQINPKNEASGARGVANWLSGLMAEVPMVQGGLVEFFNHVPRLVPHMVNQALDTLRDTNYCDKSFDVLNLGTVNDVKAYAVELAFDCATFVQSIDNLLALFAQSAQVDGWYQPGPIGIRFVQSAAAYLAPQFGRPTVMAEMDMLSGVKNGDKLLSAIETVMLAEPGVRVHWGLELDTLKGSQIAGMYPNYDKWLAVYHQLNSSGMFNNQFTSRMNISVGSLATA